MTTTAGQYLSKKMAAAGITVKDIQEHLSLKSPSNVAEWLSGSRHIPEHHINTIAAFVPGVGRETLRNKVKGKPAKAPKAAKKVIQSVTPVVPINMNDLVINNAGLVQSIKPLQFTAQTVVPKTGTVVHWFKVDPSNMPPSDKAHWRYNGREVYIVKKDNAIHAPHADVTHWAHFETPQPPITVRSW